MRSNPHFLPWHGSHLNPPYRRTLSHDIANAGIAALVYLLTRQVGLQFVVQPENISVLWPPAGILLGALLIIAPRA